MQIQIRDRVFGVGTKKAAFYATALAQAIEKDAKFGESNLAKAMLGILGDEKADAETKTQEIGAAVNGYYNEARLIAPPTTGGRLEGTLFNACLASSPIARRQLTVDQTAVFGPISAEEIAQFVTAAREVSVRWDGMGYDFESYTADLLDAGSKDAQALLAVFGLEEPAAEAIVAAVNDAWLEGGTKQDAREVRHNLRIEVPGYGTHTRTGVEARS